MFFPRPTQEQVQDQIKKFELYDYYGIPYGEFDDSGEENITQRDMDISEARLFILQKKKIPKDLEIRLLKYKQEDQQKKLNHHN